MEICLFDNIPLSKIWERNALGSIIGNKKEYPNGSLYIKKQVHIQNFP